MKGVQERGKTARFVKFYFEKIRQRMFQSTFLQSKYPDTFEFGEVFLSVCSPSSVSKFNSFYMKMTTFLRSNGATTEGHGHYKRRSALPEKLWFASRKGEALALICFQHAWVYLTMTVCNSKTGGSRKTI